MGNRIRSSPSQNKDGLVTRSIHSGKETDVENRAVKRPLVRLNIMSSSTSVWDWKTRMTWLPILIRPWRSSAGINSTQD